MPPPTIRTSSRGRRFSRVSILPSILAPPRIAANGRSGSPSRRESASTSRTMQAPGGAPRQVRHDADDRGVGAVRGAEGVVDVGVGAGARARARTRGRSSPRRRGSAGSRAARRRRRRAPRRPPRGRLADAVVGEGDRLAEQLGEPDRDRPQAVLRVALPLRPPAVRDEQQPRAGARRARGSSAAPRRCACRR